MAAEQQACTSPRRGPGPFGGVALCAGVEHTHADVLAVGTQNRRAPANITRGVVRSESARLSLVRLISPPLCSMTKETRKTKETKATRRARVVQIALSQAQELKAQATVSRRPHRRWLLDRSRTRTLPRRTCFRPAICRPLSLWTRHPASRMCRSLRGGQGQMCCRCLRQTRQGTCRSRGTVGMCRSLGT